MPSARESRVLGPRHNDLYFGKIEDKGVFVGIQPKYVCFSLDDGHDASFVANLTYPPKLESHIGWDFPIIVRSGGLNPIAARQFPRGRSAFFAYTKNHDYHTRDAGIAQLVERLIRNQ